MKKFSIYSLLIICAAALAEDPANPEVVYPIEIIGRSWIDSSDIREKFDPPLTMQEASKYLAQVVAPLSIDWSIANDTRGIDKDNAYRLWCKVVLEAKTKNNVLAVKVVTTDQDGGGELLNAVSGSINLTPPLLVKVSDTKYTIDFNCWGAPHPLAERALQGVRRRTSVNIWHRIQGDIMIEAGAVKYTFKFRATSAFPMHTLYVNTILIEEKKQGYISDLWTPLPGLPTFVVQGP